MAVEQLQAQMQYIDLADFTPGIHGDYFSVTGAYPDGSAQVKNTWGCVGVPTGGLLAGPKKIDYNLQGPIQVAAGAYEPNHQYDMINGFIVTPQIGIAKGVPLYRACAVIVGFQNYFKANPQTGAYTQNSLTKYYKCFNTLNQINIPSFNIIAINSVTDRTPDNADLNYYSGPMALSRCNNAAPTTKPGTPTLACAQVAWDGLAGAITSSFLAFPKNSTPTVDSSETIPLSSGIIPNQLVAHQGRFIASSFAEPLTGFARFGTSAAFTQSSDALDYTAVNDYSNSSGLTNGVCLAPESPGGVGALTTMNASELFVVRKYGGAYSIRGDIDNPQVVSLPSVTPTGLDANTGTLTPSGFVYGTTYGVYLWGGGDTSQCISDQLFGVESPHYDLEGHLQRSGPFWRDTASLIGVSGTGGSAAQFQYVYPYIFTPNNWIFDTRTQAWFRFSDPSGIIYSWFGQAPDGDVIAAPTLISPNQQEVFSWWDPTQGTDYYTWTSQPLNRSQGRYIEARELSIKCQGHGLIRITLTGLGESQTDVQEFQFNSPDKPILITRGISCISTDMVVQIESFSADPPTSKFVLDSTIPAPRLYSLRIGYQENQTAR